MGRFGRVELAPLRARAEHEVVALLVERDAFASGEPENHAPTVASSIRSVSSTAPCHGAIPFGGTNSIVASSSISSSAHEAHRRRGEPPSPAVGPGSVP